MPGAKTRLAPIQTRVLSHRNSRNHSVCRSYHMVGFGTTLFALIALLSPRPGGAQSPAPLVLGVDHIPLVVADLEKAEADFRTMGFSLKPGRVHADGIRNAHVKFSDGTEIELITAPAAVDSLTAEYRAKLKDGDGPVYFGLYAPDRAALAAKLAAAGIPSQNDEGLLGFPSKSLLHRFFFGNRNKSPTDKPEHFAHANSANRLSALWVNENRELRALFQKLGIGLAPARPCAPICEFTSSVAMLPEGNVYFVPSARTNVVVARVEVQSLRALQTVLKRNNIPVAKGIKCNPGAIWISPAMAHGIWLEFVARR
jgi:hypothetical protein